MSIVSMWFKNKRIKIMEYKKKTRVFPVVLLAVILLLVMLPFVSNGQEIFSPQTPSQETMQNMPTTNKGPLLRAGGGTGTGDGTNGGGGTENNGHQNDTEAPTSDALFLVLLMTAGYAINKKLRIRN